MSNTSVGQARVREIGVSSCNAQISGEEIYAFRQAGVTQMEFCFPHDTYLTADWRQLGREARDADMNVRSVHLPFFYYTYGVSHPDAAIRRSTLDNYRRIVEESSVTGARIFVVHPSLEPIPDLERDVFMQYAKEGLSALAAFAAEGGARIAVENLPRTCLGRTSSEIAELISAHDNLFVCFDTNHLLIEDTLSFVKALGDKIIATHFSDYDFVDEKHWLPGEGKVDWVSLMNALDETAYDGPITYEVNYHGGGMKRSRNLRPEDFVRNARELLARAPLTRVL